ncbi:MAG TPA: UDP-N-acetylglucosamine 1-carboxyvinyltransferase, partial [Verrucomicrobiota bacterium]|nr:UDP-N-acetylglucosamine 1-carboxyvinyltransferase [Verrucomicrobiota bacterium]
MDCLVIKGGTPLKGDVKISGAKNAALPLMAATLLTSDQCVLRNLPNLSDVQFMARILESLGASVEMNRGTIRVRARKIDGFGDYDLIRKMRGSICILGPLMARLNEAKVSMPGGCVIGARPIDLHLKGMRDLGAKVRVEAGYVHAKTKRLTGCESFLGGRCGPTVLGTANMLMAASLAKGKTLIHSAACEPEIEDLAKFLNAMGAKISGAGSPTITIQGVRRLRGAEHRVIPDRIEAATY